MSSSSHQPDWKRFETRYLNPKMSIYYKWKVFRTIKLSLIQVGGETLVEQFKSGCFGHFLSWKGGNSASRALLVLLSYEINSDNPDEIWFSIQDTQFRFCPIHYALVSGLNFGCSNFDPAQGTHDPSRVGVYIRVANGQPIVLKELLRKFAKCALHEGSNDVHVGQKCEDYLKVANIIALYFFCLGFAESRKVENWAWILVDDLSAWNRFPWGAYTYGALMHYVGITPRTASEVTSRYHLYGPIWALQIWAYETMPTLGSVAASHIFPCNIPRVLRWEFGTRPELDFDYIFGHQFVYREMIVSTNEVEQGYYTSMQSGEIFGVRFLRVDNPLRPRQVRDGRPVLFRKASRPRRIKNASVQIEEEGESIQQPQRRTRGKGKSRGTSSSKYDGGDASVKLQSRDYDRFKKDLIHHLDTVVVPRMVDKMTGFFESVGSSHPYRSKSKARVADEMSSTYRDVSAQEREPSQRSMCMSNQIACREPSQHSMSKLDRSARREPSRNSVEQSQTHLDLRLQL